MENFKNLMTVSYRKYLFAFILFVMMISMVIPNDLKRYFAIAILFLAIAQFCYLFFYWREWFLKVGTGVIIAMLLALAIVLIGRLF